MTAILHFGSSAARTQSQVRRFTSIREATGKLRSAGAGRAVPTSFDLGIDCKVPWRDTIKGLLFPFSDGCSPPVALCSKRSPGRSLLSDPQGEQGFLSLVPYLVSPSLLSHIWEDWNENFFAVWVLLCFVIFYFFFCFFLSFVPLSMSGRMWNEQCFQIKFAQSFQIKSVWLRWFGFYFLFFVFPVVTHSIICFGNNSRKKKKGGGGKTWLIYTFIYRYD